MDGIIANVQSQATVAMGSQIDGSAKAAKAAKRKSRGDVPKGDAEKIESLHVKLDAMKKLFSLLDQTSQCVESISSTTNTSKNQLKPVLEALQYVVTTGREQLKGISSNVDNTSAKTRSVQAHSKVTKDARRQEKDLEQERRLHRPTDPKKALQAALKQTMKDLDALVKPKDLGQLKSPPESQTEATHNPPPRKRHQPASSDELAELDKEERGRRIRDSIRLPKPLHQRLIYSPREAIHVYQSMCNANNVYPQRDYANHVKQRMIDDKLVPVARTRLNELIKLLTEGKELPLRWNARGRPEIMSYQQLKDIFVENSQRIGATWSLDNTKATLLEAERAKLTARGIDASNVTEPCKETVYAYHSALETDPDIAMRASQAKNSAREAAETSKRSMTCTSAAAIASRFYVAPNIDQVPPERRFNESLATEGCKLARQLYATARGVPVHTVQSAARETLFNTDDVARAYHNFRGTIRKA